MARNGRVRTGIDVLAGEHFARLRGKRVGVITNHTGLSADGRRNIDLMVEAGVQVAAVFSPEHGSSGEQDVEDIVDGRDPATGIPIWSLYNAGRRRPTDEMLQAIDMLVYDIQDVGARFYTYTCTMVYAMEEAARHDISFLVLDPAESGHRRPRGVPGA